MSAIDFPHHDVSIIVGGKQVKSWETYEIEATMLEPANHFSVRMPFEREVWDLCKPDRPVQVLIDDVTVLTGYIDERLVPEDDESVEIVGRSKVGRLVQESAPGISYAGSDVFRLTTEVAAPWFTKVTFSNARNRKILRGKGKKAKAVDKAVTLGSKKSVGTHIQPGMSRWQVIEDLCSQAGYLAWETGDGIELVVGEPNYDQEPQFRFFMPAANSKRAGESTVLGMGVHNSVADRYSRIIVVGSGVGTDANYGAAVASRFAEAKDNPDDPEGVGEDFTAPKRLIRPLAVESIAEAQELADREMGRRDISSEQLTVRAPGHGQVIAGSYTTLFTYDTLASCEDERTGVNGVYFITGCTYRSSRQGGEETLLHLIPRGTRLVS